jgi:hypothetical protein
MPAGDALVIGPFADADRPVTIVDGSVSLA